MIQETVKEEDISFRFSINLFNKSNLPYTSFSYFFITKVAGAEMRQRIDKDMAEQSTPQVNSASPTKLKSLLHKKMLFKYPLIIPPHSFPASYHTELLWIAPQMDLIVWANKELVIVLANHALLPYPSRGTTTMQLRLVRWSMCQ